MWLGIGAIVLMGLFPPWSYTIPARTINTLNPVALEQRAEWRAEHPNGIDFSDLIYPETITQHISARTERGYGLLIAPKWSRSLAVRYSLDVSRLSIQWAMVAIVMGGLLVSVKDRQKS